MIKILMICFEILGGIFNIIVEGQEYSVVVEELDFGVFYRMWMMAEVVGGVGLSIDFLYVIIFVLGI